MEDNNEVANDIKSINGSINLIINKELSKDKVEFQANKFLHTAVLAAEALIFKVAVAKSIIANL